ncbi:hypothetical protein GCM10010365_39750 [Streptomyces poonensis]|uniref:Uncharacterized protein n=1 Tax=Streptomyces poonensis TaxID=68255 RepID=A0A918PMG1_9ACTN|nr:hypothetical protein GCM10010365_39750 [Streptomyces poonensis]
MAQEVGELPGPVRAQPPPVGGDGGRALSGVFSDAFGRHARNHTDAVGNGVLPKCCATCRVVSYVADLRFPRYEGLDVPVPAGECPCPPMSARARR